MATAAQSGSVRRIQHYSDAFSDLLPMESVPLDLVMEEIQLRKESGVEPARDEYQRLFPRFEAMFDHFHHPTEATTACRKMKAPPEFKSGEQIDDFLLIQLLGKGAFASVYLAQQVSMQRLVALKISRGNREESQSLARFDHTNIVRVFDQRDLTNQNIHLLYMQFQPGGTLADVVKLVRSSPSFPTGALILESIDHNLNRTSQSIPEGASNRVWLASASWPAIVASIGMQLADALQEAHHQGVLHRDVKPANVLLSAEGTPKLADFNVSFAGSAGRAGAAASFGGSIGYMAPEHLKAIGARSSLAVVKVEEAADIYSLAVLLWELWQGRRPFVDSGPAPSWSVAISHQIAARSVDFIEPKREGGASERVLENVLRSALAYRPEDRPADGATLASKLKLALHPEAASLFDFSADPLRWKLLNLSPWILATFVILTPNLLGGLLNFLYNNFQVMHTDEMRAGLCKVSWYVNLTFFPFGAALIVYFALSVIRAVKAVQKSEAVSPKDITATLTLGHRSAVIGGSLWLLGGVTFPIALSFMFPDFTMAQAVHLVISSLVCGGIAMAYPFFGIAIVASWIYYPCFVRGSMQDAQFNERRKRMMRLSEVYLLISAIIPMLGAILLISNESSSRAFTLAAVGAGLVGLLVSTMAHRVVASAWSRMSEVLSSSDAAKQKTSQRLHGAR
jgi:serine/threonine protein kinase